MKVLIALFVSVFFLATNVLAEVSTNTEAKVIYNPQMQSKSFSAPAPQGLPYLGGSHAPTDRNQEVINLPWAEVEMSVIRPEWSFWDLFQWSKPYKESIWFKEEPNEEPLKILTKPSNGRMLGQIQLTDMGDEAPFEVVKRALWYAKQETNATEVLILGRKIPIAKGNSKGIGASSLTANVSGGYQEAITVGGSGLLSYSSGWIDHGLEVTILCYGPNGQPTMEVPTKDLPEQETVVPVVPTETDDVLILKMMMEGGSK